MKTRALVLCDDQWHPAETVRRGLDALKNLPLDLEYLEDGSRWTPSLMKNFPLVVVAKANHVCATNQNPWLGDETQSAFRDFVRGGGGLLLLHGGVCYKDLPVMRAVSGGAFLRHPDPCAVTFEPKAARQITLGVSPFTETDEQYFVSLDTDKTEVFLQSRSMHGVQPAGWTRVEGAGRVCVLTLGHNPDVWMHPEFQKVLLNAFRWTAKLN
jgi:uncharacterized protein